MALPALDLEPEVRTGHQGRFWLTNLLAGQPDSSLSEDVLAGLSAIPKALPPKYFYDERGAHLFDAICRTPEYYQTRTEEQLLLDAAAEIVAEARPTGLIELGSGAATKTRLLLDEVVRYDDAPRYVPVDISESMLISSAESLLADYPTLRVHGVVADYDHHLHLLPEGPRRLIAFLGGTLGNFDHPGARDFLAAIAAGMTDRDRLLVGLDLVKTPAVLHAAYNDAAGLTAEFNRNVLRVVNRFLGANFDPGAFEHVAFWRPELAQIEMHLEARHRMFVDVPALDRRYEIAAGERVHTEISRKFTRADAAGLIGAAGLELIGWYASRDEYFALAVAALP